MFVALSIAALSLAGVMAVTGPPSTFDPVNSAAQDNARIEYVAQNAGTEQPQL